MTLSPRPTAAWQRALSPVTPVTARAFASGSIPFNMAGLPLARDSAVIEAGADLRVGAQATFGASYAGQFAGSIVDHVVKGRFALGFCGSGPPMSTARSQNRRSYGSLASGQAYEDCKPFVIHDLARLGTARAAGSLRQRYVQF